MVAKQREREARIRGRKVGLCLPNHVFPKKGKNLQPSISFPSLLFLLIHAHSKGGSAKCQKSFKQIAIQGYSQTHIIIQQDATCRARESVRRERSWNDYSIKQEKREKKSAAGLFLLLVFGFSLECSNLGFISYLRYSPRTININIECHRLFLTYTLVFKSITVFIIYSTFNKSTEGNY